jgi:hypothetical protein
MSDKLSSGVALRTFGSPVKAQIPIPLPRLGFGPGPLSDEALSSLIAVWMVVGILSQKLCFLIGPTTGVQIAVVWQYILIAYLVYRGNVLIGVARLFFVMLFFASTLIVSFFNNPVPTSLFYVFGLYLPFMLIVKMDRPNYMRVLEVFQLLALFTSLLSTPVGFQASGAE